MLRRFVLPLMFCMMLAGCGSTETAELKPAFQDFTGSLHATEQAVDRITETEVAQGKEVAVNVDDLSEEEYVQYMQQNARKMPVMKKFNPDSNEYEWDSFPYRVVAHVGNAVIAGEYARLEDIIKECRGKLLSGPHPYPYEDSTTYMYLCR
jgi:hypothetical protein